ncbi:Hint domain-containing protein [Alloyangia pacifica]|uniref:Hint domain-containing protein n=1 Tax=Alloyangia pacifica TaxID=311180 RepID=A0A1I6QWD2_9RHOB|nr:Hint domain-containing protein [Alloyangia pacifica]SDG01337.1 Hint domain-containing protein [Alloyangia pacifica]SFS56568.1 Hint domain-containing protein [Alloyangia pacifica]
MADALSDAGRRAAHSVTVYRGAHLRVVSGANLGDELSFAEELQPDDVYALSPAARPMRLAVLPAGASPFRIAAESDLGQPGADLHLDACLTFMSGDGTITEALLLVATTAEGLVAEVCLMPLAPMLPRKDYALVGVSRDTALARFAQAACVSFTGGTMITLASGAQRAVEDLRVGDRVLTRDDGPQELRWIGHQTLRAVGAFAPILIRAGTLNAARDLLVSPDHRLFVYQRSDRLGAGRSELLLRARHLINGETVLRQEGGFVDYFQMLFDHHQIIYAEGIAAESMLVDTRTRAALPAELSGQLAGLLPRHRSSDQPELEVQETLLQRPDVAELLRRSSAG